MIIRCKSVLTLACVKILFLASMASAELRDDPAIPLIKAKSISFVEQFVVESQKIVDTNRITYADELKLIRYDTIPFTGSMQGIPIRVINDYNSGVGYLINKPSSVCMFYSIQPGYDGLSLGSGGGEQIKDPNQLFFIDSSLAYSGSSKRRDIEVDEFRSTRTDFKSPFISTQPANWIVSHFFMKAGLVEEASDANVAQPPVVVEIQSSPEMNEKYTINIYDFDPTVLTPTDFDVSNCFRGKEKTQFAIQFGYPHNYTQQELEGIMQLEVMIDRYFYKAIIDRLSQQYNFSPVRIIPPKIRFHRRGFELYTGVTDNAPPIYHFTKVADVVQVNVNMALNKIVGASADACAFKCLNDTASTSSSFKCLSFDACPNSQGSGFVCVFYSTFTTDPNLIQQGQPACEHYSKNVESFDGSSKDDLYRAIEYSVVKKELKIEVPVGTQTLSFPANNIYAATYDASSPNNEGIVTGTTSFFSSFRIVSHDMDFLVARVEASQDHQIRERLGVSIDECARLCRFEARFKCESLSYEAISRDCKWSSIFYEFYNNQMNPYTNYSEGFTIYASNSLVDYVLFPFAVSPEDDLKEYPDATSTYQCAYKCTTETEFKCKSFNFCEFYQGANFKVKCLLSDKHTHDMNSDNLTFSAVCTHYTRQSLDDFTLTSGKQLNVKAVSLYERLSVEACSSLCAFSEGFVCRSFDFALATRNCYLYDQDSAKGSKLIDNDGYNHYSRNYFEENGEDLTGLTKSGTSKYSGGAVFGVTVAFIVLGLIVGAGAIFVYAFYIRGVSFGGSGGSSSTGSDVPHMTFKNPASE